MSLPTAPSPRSGPARPPRRILFVEQFYYPDGWGGAELPLDLTVHLAQAGFAVEVICGSDQYAPLEDDPPADPRSQGVRIRRIPALLRGNIHRAKLLRQLWFYLALAPLLLLRRPPEVFITQTNPPLGVILVAVAARLWRRPLVIIAMDVYPDVLIAHGAGGAATLGRLLQGAFAWAYRQAQRVIALGPVMRERLEHKGVSAGRIVEIPNWATGTQGLALPAANALRQEWDLEGKFVVLYSGNLGLAHEFDTLLQGVKCAMDAIPALRVVFIGRGSRLEEVRRQVDELGLGAIVRFSDLLPARRLPESFGIADVAVVTLRGPFAGLVVPSKLQGYMARGIPTLYIGPDSDIERFITRSAGGISIRCRDVPGVCTALTELAASRERLTQLGTQARQFYEREFARQHGLARYEAVLGSVLEQAPLLP
jgi:glycosyltransferase involved in cell wall biosynthesis